MAFTSIREEMMNMIELSRESSLKECDSVYDHRIAEIKIMKKMSKNKINEGYNKMRENALKTININHYKSDLRGLMKGNVIKVANDKYHVLGPEFTFGIDLNKIDSNKIKCDNFIECIQDYKDGNFKDIERRVDDEIKRAEREVQNLNDNQHKNGVNNNDMNDMIMNNNIDNTNIPSQLSSLPPPTPYPPLPPPPKEYNKITSTLVKVCKNKK